MHAECESDQMTDILILDCSSAQQLVASGSRALTFAALKMRLGALIFFLNLVSVPIGRG